MPRFVTLQQSSKKAYWIDPDQVAALSPLTSKTTTVILASGNRVVVMGAPSDIAAKLTQPRE